MVYGMPFVSSMQSNRKGFGRSELDLTDMSDSIGPAKTADLIIGVTQSEEFKKAWKYIWCILKTRYGLKNKHIVDIDYPKMRLYEKEENEEENEDSDVISHVENLRTKNKNETLNNIMNIDI